MSSISLDFYGHPSLSSFPFLSLSLFPSPNDGPVGVAQKGLKNAVAISCITHMSEFGENFLTNHERTRRARWW